MEEKTQSLRRISRYTFSKAQVEAGDVRGFLAKYDPVKLGRERCVELMGAVEIRLEDFEDKAVSLDPKGRILVRRLQAIWPWSAFFLDLGKPLGSEGKFNKYPLLAIAWAISDFTLLDWCGNKGIRMSEHYWKYEEQCHEALGHLGKRCGLTDEALRLRHEEVRKQFAPKI